MRRRVSWSRPLFLQERRTTIMMMAARSMMYYGCSTRRSRTRRPAVRCASACSLYVRAAANRVPGRAALAAADLRDVLEHGAEHARAARRRGALLELSRALQDDAAARRDALAEAVAVLDAAALAAPDGRDSTRRSRRGATRRAHCAWARLELGLSPACDDAAGPSAARRRRRRWAPAARGTRRRAGARLAARDAKRFGAIPPLAASDARAAVRRARARAPCAGRPSGRRSAS